MKKNTMMRIASVLLVAVLLSTCTISGTFAKYVTSGTSTDTARVAKFGVGVTAVSNSMFSDSYAKTDTTYTLGDNTVVGTGSAKVVAPGTNGSLTAVTLSGTPEVAVRVTNVATVELGNNWQVESAYYCPLVVTVGTTEYFGGNYANADAFEAAIKAAIDAYTADYAPGTDLSAQTGACPVVSWAWDFANHAHTGDTGYDQTDVQDTALGNAAAANVANAGTISVTVVTTVTQID